MPKGGFRDGASLTNQPVITRAALIMISMIGAFVLSSDVTAKLFRVGLGVAVLLDVTLVRMVLVPAAMSLLGHRAWWLPGPLARVLPTFDLDGRRPSADLEAAREGERELEAASSSNRVLPSKHRCDRSRTTDVHGPV